MKIYIKSSSDVYDPFRGHTYLIEASDGLSDSDGSYADDPEKAIQDWFKLNSKQQYSTNVAILCKTKQDALNLVSAGTEDYLTDMWNKYGCPYKLDQLIQSCKNQQENGCRFFHEHEYGDMVFPFDVG